MIRHFVGSMSSGESGGLAGLVAFPNGDVYGMSAISLSPKCRTQLMNCAYGCIPGTLAGILWKIGFLWNIGRRKPAPYIPRGAFLPRCLA